MMRRGCGGKAGGRLTSVSMRLRAAGCWCVRLCEELVGVEGGGTALHFTARINLVTTYN